MSATDDLEKKVISLRDQLRDAKLKWHAARMSEFRFQPGDILSKAGEIDRVVARLFVRYDDVRVIARRRTKTGWHGSEHELYFLDEWKQSGRDESICSDRDVPREQ